MYVCVCVYVFLRNVIHIDSSSVYIVVHLHNIVEHTSCLRNGRQYSHTRFSTMLRVLVLVTLVVNGGVVWCKPVQQQSKLPTPEAFKFMRKFGYLEPGTEDSEALYSEEAVVDAIKEMQKFGAIPQTGIVDNATMQLMLTPRCGVPDIQRPSEFRRRKRYVIAAPGWKKRNITYFLANWTPKLGEEAVMKNIQTALDAWGRYARLSFHHVPDPSADIIVAFGRGPHGDGYPFDGPGNILAHAFFPYEQGALGGDIHFDDDENWQINPAEYDDGVDFFTVAVHELGHSLGLGHSPVHESIMFPYYKGYSSTFALGYDDILAMYQLYIQTRLDGDDKTTEAPWERVPPVTEANHNPTTTPHQPATSTTQATTVVTSTEWTYAGDYETVDEHKTHEPPSTTTVSALPDICDGSYDAVATLRGELFVFKDEYVWRLHSRGTVEPGYPVPFRQLFPKLPETVTRIDAAYERNKDGYIIMFSGRQYWVFDGDNFVEGSPRPLTDYGLPAVLDRLDAAQVWKKNGKVYMYRNEMFWRYNETSGRMDAGYPHHIKRWRGVPADLDAATTWTDGFTYFFKGRLFWRFDNYLIKTDERYPLPAPQTWMGCPEKPDTMFWLPPI